MEEALYEVLNYLANYGLMNILFGIVIFLIIKYAPRVIELKLKRMEEKDYILDAFKAVIVDNSRVIENNSSVIKLNSETIKNYTDNAHKLENKFDAMAERIDNQNKLIVETNTILKERKTYRD